MDLESEDIILLRKLITIVVILVVGSVVVVLLDAAIGIEYAKGVSPFARVAHNVVWLAWGVITGHIVLNK